MSSVSNNFSYSSCLGGSFEGEDSEILCKMDFLLLFFRFETFIKSLILNEATFCLLTGITALIKMPISMIEREEE